jgi:hypothetical protein
MKYSIILLFPFFFLSCKNDDNSNKVIPSTKKSLEQIRKKDSLESVQNEIPSNPHISKVLNIDDILVNGQKILMSKDEFKLTYGQIDSVKVESRECGNPFEWLDKEWMIKTYGVYDDQMGTFKNFDSRISVFYSNHASFDSNNHLYLLNTTYTDKNTVNIISKNILLTNKTSLAEFESLFPKAEKEILENSSEVRFRLFLEDGYDNSFLFYFKNDKFKYLTLWWLLC